MKNRQKRSHIDSFTESEKGTLASSAPLWIALGYPAPYSVAASSLGFQTVYRTWNQHARVGCERFVQAPDQGTSGTTLESGRPAREANAVAFSLACETDLLAVVQMLRQMGLSPLSAERPDDAPPVICGGPLTLLDPALMADLADVVVCGEGEDALFPIADALADARDKSDFLSRVHILREVGGWVPALQPVPPAAHMVSLAQLPAFAATWSPLADFKDLFLVEIARGCPRRCAFCLLANSGRFRRIPQDAILSKIPDDASGVGLVGAAVTDHPDLGDIVSSIVATNRRVSLSSMRADRLTPALLKDLVRGGLRTLTVAADGSSQCIRDRIHKGITAQHLIDASRMAREMKLRGLKLYSMVGLPDETDDDIREFAALVTELAGNIRLTVAVQSFVPKPNTPLGDGPMLDIKALKQRLNLFQRLMKGRVTIQSTSPRWSWVDWRLAHAGPRAVAVAMMAADEGGEFSAWKRAIDTLL
ncbi:MAG: radical SAM protein [Deltaproteobacteria bacterium]|nr:radical SAM protein [Deltaproteobacteria bacterium]